MEECWTIDHKSRPTFAQLTPQIQELLNDSHKQIYDVLNERFMKQCNDLKKERIQRKEISSQAPRESTQAPPYILPSKPVNPNQPQTSSNDQPAATDGYLQPVNNNSPINNSSNTNKNKKQPQQSGYLEPENPFRKPQSSSNQPSYLEPVNNRKYLPDTYGGARDSSKNQSIQDTYLNSDNIDDGYMNDGNAQRDAYVNDDFVNELDSNRFRSSNDYFKRVGSNTSTSTVNSTASSTAPLKMLKSPASLAAQQRNRLMYAPPPAQNPVKLSTFKPSNETDV